MGRIVAGDRPPSLAPYPIAPPLRPGRQDYMGDSGINEKVEQKEWDEMVGMIVEAMKAGNPGDGLVKAINKCGTLLEKRGVEIREDDTNELDNTLRMSDK